MIMKKILINIICFLLLLVIPAQSFAICAALKGKQLKDLATIECPRFDGTAKTACKPDHNGPLIQCILNGEEPPIAVRPDYGLGSPKINQVTSSGKCLPPLQVASSLISSLLPSESGGCQTSGVKDVNNILKTTINNTLGGYAKNAIGGFITNPTILNSPLNLLDKTVTDAMGRTIEPPPASAQPAVNPNVDVTDLSNYCLRHATIATPAPTCGAAIPALRRFDPINVSSCNIPINVAACKNGKSHDNCGCAVVGNVIYPDANKSVSVGSFIEDAYLATTTRVVNNPVNTVSACNSNVSPYSLNNNTIFHITGDRNSLIVPPSNSAISIQNGSYSYHSNSYGNIHLPYGDPINIFSYGLSITKLPKGGSILSPTNDELKIPGSIKGTVPVIVSYGNGTMIIPLGGMASKGDIKQAVDSYNTHSSAGDHTVKGSTYTTSGLASTDNATVSQYLTTTTDVPNNLWSWIMDNSGWISYSWTGSFWKCPSATGLPSLIPNSAVDVECLHHAEEDNDYWYINKITLKGQYLDYSGKNSATVYATTVASSSNATINTRNVSAPHNSFLSLPNGTPVEFNIKQAGYVTLPAGGSFVVPGGDTIGASMLTPDGTTYSLVCPNCAPIHIKVSQNNQLVSNGNQTVVLPNDVLYAGQSTNSFTIDLSGATNSVSSDTGSSFPPGTNITLPTGEKLPLGTSAPAATGAVPPIASAGVSTSSNSSINSTILTANGGEFTLISGTIITTPDGSSNTLPVPEYINIPAGSQLVVSPDGKTFTLPTTTIYSFASSSVPASKHPVPSSYDVPLPTGTLLPAGTIITFPASTDYISIITNAVGVDDGVSVAIETDTTSNNDLMLPPQSPASDPQQPSNGFCASR